MDTTATIDLESLARVQDRVLASINDDWSPPRLLPAGWELEILTGDGAWYRCVTGLKLCVTRCRELDGKRWVHVSLSHRSRLPKYRELAAVKDWTIGRNAKAIQVFAPATEHVNIHPNCLHLFSCLDGDSLPDFTHGTGSL